MKSWHRERFLILHLRQLQSARACPKTAHCVSAPAEAQQSLRAITATFSDKFPKWKRKQHASFPSLQYRGRLWPVHVMCSFKCKQTMDLQLCKRASMFQLGTFKYAVHPERVWVQKNLVKHSSLHRSKQLTSLKDGAGQTSASSTALSFFVCTWHTFEQTPFSSVQHDHRAAGGTEHLWR